jgi:hypothetical protein
MSCRTYAAVISCMLIGLCTSRANSDHAGKYQAEISEQQAIEIAKKEILQRGVALPKHAPWAAAVVSDTEPSRPIYWVVFAPPMAAEKGIQVMVDRASGEVVDFVDPRTFITAQRAIQIAKKELARHGISLPKNWGISVILASDIVEITFEPPGYGVSFYPPGKDKRSAIYNVTVDARTGKVDSFSDYRMAIDPYSGAIELKGVGKEYVKRLKNTLATQKRFRGVQIHTSKTGIISITPSPGMSEHDKADLERLIRGEINWASE